MNRDILQGNWKQLKGGIKEQWGKLTDDDIVRAEGNFEKLAGRVQERYGLSREEAEKRVDEFLQAQKASFERNPVGRA
ncbi:MAG: CsbD family protein [Trueperaceae bacterium]|nr:CsbD family protein [Trueperaceae bacterium]